MQKKIRSTVPHICIVCMHATAFEQLRAIS